MTKSLPLGYIKVVVWGIPGRRCRRAEVAEWQTRYVQGVVSITGVRVQISPSAPFLCACSSVWIERSPAEAEVEGSSPSKRTTTGG